MEQITSNRRHFCKGLLSAGALLGMGCPCLRAAEKEGEKHKFQMDAEMSFEQVFMFAFDPPVKLVKGLRSRIGPEKFMRMLEETCEKIGQDQGRQMAKDLGDNSLSAWASVIKKPDHFWQHVITREIVEDTPEAFAIEVTECLWCKTFRQLGASDLGYACICRPDAAMARGFNPKLKLIRTKTLMQGHDCCDARYVVGA